MITQTFFIFSHYSTGACLADPRTISIRNKFRNQRFAIVKDIYTCKIELTLFVVSAKIGCSEINREKRVKRQDTLN